MSTAIARVNRQQPREPSCLLHAPAPAHRRRYFPPHHVPALRQRWRLTRVVGNNGHTVTRPRAGGIGGEMWARWVAGRLYRDADANQTKDRGVRRAQCISATVSAGVGRGRNFVLGSPIQSSVLSLSLVENFTTVDVINDILNCHIRDMKYIVSISVQHPSHQ